MRIVIFSTDSALVQKLGSGGHRLEYVSFAEGTGAQVSQREGLDALLLTPFEAEHFGVSSPTMSGIAKIGRADDRSRAKGIPTFIVSGVLLPHAERRDWNHELQEFLRAGIAAVEEHNARSSEQITAIGVLAEDLLVRHLGIDVVRKELLRVEDQLRTAAGS